MVFSFHPDAILRFHDSKPAYRFQLFTGIYGKEKTAAERR